MLSIKLQHAYLTPHSKNAAQNARGKKLYTLK